MRKQSGRNKAADTTEGPCCQSPLANGFAVNRALAGQQHSLVTLQRAARGAIVLQTGLGFQLGEQLEDLAAL